MDPKTRSFLGAIAEAIKALCMTLIGLFKVADHAVAMADKAIVVARERQAVELVSSQAGYSQRVRDQAALNQVKSQIEIDDFVKANPERKEMMLHAQEQIGKLIEQELAEIRAKK